VCDYEFMWRLMKYRISVDVSYCDYACVAKEERHISRMIFSSITFLEFGYIITCV
jgi:hypothetical protein